MAQLLVHCYPILRVPEKKRVFLTANFGYATANFGPLLRGKSHSSDINHRVSIILTRGSQKTS